MMLYSIWRNTKMVNNRINLAVGFAAKLLLGMFSYSHLFKGPVSRDFCPLFKLVKKTVPESTRTPAVNFENFPVLLKEQSVEIKSLQ